MYLVAQNLQTGSKTYVDQDYVFSSLPSYLLGVEHIQTANSDRAITDSSFISFTVSANASIYVAFDSRNTTVPSWLTGSFTKQAETLQAGGPTFDIYKRDYSQGQTVTLGGNSATGNRMYSVMVTSR